MPSLSVRRRSDKIKSAHSVSKCFWARALLGKHLNFCGTLSFTVIGGVLYYLVVVTVLWLKLNSNDLKLFTAVIVALFLAVPYLREQSKSSFSRLKKKGAAPHA